MSTQSPLFFTLILLAGCVTYDRQDASITTIAGEIDAVEGGSFAFSEAAALTLSRHPEVLAAQARARAAGLARAVPWTINSEWRGRNEAIGAMLDPIAILGLGPRGAEIELADAQTERAVTELAVARWRSLAELAEAYALHRTAARLQPPELSEVQADAFDRAGLASAVAVAMLRAAEARARAEGVELQRLADDQLARMRHLLGLPPTATLTPLHDDGPVAPKEFRARDLLSRPDITLAAARFEIADREFRRAVAAQYPALQIGPSVSLRGDPLRAMGMLRLPIAMDGLAAAARERRTAARHEIKDALLEARLEAETAGAERAAAEATKMTAQAALEAQRAALLAARVALDVEPDAFESYAKTANEYVQAVSQSRSAAAALAVAEVRHAVAYGWPNSGLEEDLL